MKKKPSLILSVVYDNHIFDPKLISDWGFSCFVQGLEKSILFDTGRDGRILLSNLKKIRIQPEDIDLVFLSHEHQDHTGGLEAILELNPNIEIWLPQIFPEKFKSRAKKSGARVTEVKDFKEICTGAYTTGIIKGWIKEQSLLLDTEDGLVLLTGCAHPRITNIVSQAQARTKRNIIMAFGGFHLAGYEEKEMLDIIKSLRSSGVKRAGPCHCSGDEARNLFLKEYKNDYVKIGTGKKITIQ